MSNESNNDLLGKSTRAKEVQIRVVFVRIGEIDTLNEKFYSEVLIEAKWQEAKLKKEFSAKTTRDEKELVDGNKYWNPKIYVKNALNETRNFHYKIKRELKDYNDYEAIVHNAKSQKQTDEEVFFISEKPDEADSTNNEQEDPTYQYWIYEYQTVKGHFFEKLELDYFPADVQDLSIVLTTTKCDKEVRFREMKGRFSSVENNTLDKHIWHLYHHVDVRVDFNNDEDDDESNETVYTFTDIEELKNKEIINSQAQPSGTNKMMHENCWAGHKLRKTATYYLKQLSHMYYERDKIHKSDTNRHPVITFQCRAARKSGYYYWNAFLLIFLITSVVFTTFSIDLDKPYYRLPTASTLLLTSITFRWVSSGTCLPKVNYLTSLDKYSLISLTCVYLCLIWHGALPFVLNTWNVSHKILYDLDKVFLCALAIFYLIVHVFLILWLRRAHVIRRIMIEKDVNYHRRLYDNYYRNSVIDNIIEEKDHAAAVKSLNSYKLTTPSARNSAYLARSNSLVNGDQTDAFLPKAQRKKSDKLPLKNHTYFYVNPATTDN